MIALLAAILALDSADQATVGASAVQLKQALHIGNFELGLLATLSSAVGALATLPMGILADRINRVRLITGSVLLWSVAMLASGAASSYGTLLATRVALGAVVAAAGPVVASLTGDYFEAADRGRVYGFILTGELAGTGLGLLLAGNVASELSWRYAFWLLAVPGLALTWVLHRHLREPERGGGSRLSAAGSDADQGQRSGQPPPTRLAREIKDRQVEPHSSRVLREDPAGRSFWWAARYVLSIRTNVLLIAASVLGYFFFAGIRTFAVVFVRGRFDLTQGEATLLLVVIGLGAALGVLILGRLSDDLIDRHRLNARPLLAGAAYIAAALLFLPGLLVTSVWLASGLFFLAAIGLAGANAPLDAARLDIVHYRLWGRAESVRSTLRSGLQAVAPLLFGLISAKFGGTAAGVGEENLAQPRGSGGLDRAFLIMLVPLFIGGLLVLLAARRTYARDVATAAAGAPDG